VALGNVDILVRSRPEVDPYFSILMPDYPVGWRRAWFLLRNDVDTLLHAFMGGVGASHPGYRAPSFMTQNSVYDRFPLAANCWGPIHPIQGDDPKHSRLKGRGHQPKKN
jgi:hypothetical protein